MYHMQNSVQDWPRAVAQLPDGALIKVIDRGDILRDVKAINPNIKTALRHFGGPQNIFDGRGFEAYKALARQFFATFIDGTFTAQYAQHTDIVVEWNEYLASSHTGAELQDRIDWARAVAWVWRNEYQPLPAINRNGNPIRLALLSCPVGNDINRAFAEIALEYDCVLSYHAYDKFIGDHQRDPLSWRYHSGRWAFMEQAWGLKPDWMFGECGPYAGVLEGWRHPAVLNGDAAAYMEAVRTWIRELKATPAYREGRILGFNLFTTGGTSEWQWYETRQPELDQLAAMIAQEWTPPVIAPPPPPDTIPVPAGVIDIVDDLPLNPDSEDWPYETRPLSAIENVIIHHSATAPTVTPETVARYHTQNNGWPGVGYHFWIAQTGVIYKTNYLTTHSYHAGNWNRSSIGVCLAGDFTTAVPTHEQLDAARYLLQWIEDVLGPKSLLKHRDVSATACPGATWATWWPALTDEPVEPLEKVLWDTGIERQVLSLYKKAALGKAIYADGLVPMSPEFDVTHEGIAYRGQRAGSLVTDERRVYYCEIPKWETVTWINGPEPQQARWASPVGTDAERASGVIYPGAWVDATGYATYYKYGSNNQYEAYHSGNDLNRNSPTWNSDKGQPVHAVSDGVVTYARLVSGSTWGRLVVIKHGPNLFSRYAHLATLQISEGQQVRCGDVLGTIGGTEYGVADHLHIDISPTNRLEVAPTDWPGMDRARVLRDYVDPKAFLQERV